MPRPRTSPKPDERPGRVRKPDRRVARSRFALAQAMRELLHERAYGAIRVQDVLARAGVSRDTFYAHFQDRDDLFLSSFEGMLAHFDERLRGEPGAARLLPVRELVAHLDDAAPVLASLRDSEQLATVWALAQGHFARQLARRTGQVAAARFCAAGLVESLRWWLGQRQRPSPDAMDAEFHAFARRLFGRSGSVAR